MKENKNIDLIYKYLIHRLYGFPFHFPAQVVEKDSVFIPSGWDNEKKIAILHENLQSVKAEDNFEDVIVKPPVRKFVHEKEIQAEDDQVFLVKLQLQLTDVLGHLFGAFSTDSIVNLTSSLHNKHA
ncbi:cytoplasmic dynein 1 light intermediate chain 1 isoform X3 [Silurus meridionalis]|nr:cytoplasmic dynein 1 light intermediate chain 1 isoform X3 [Silurus meridionalis]